MNDKKRIHDPHLARPGPHQHRIEVALRQQIMQISRQLRQTGNQPGQRRKIGARHQIALTPQQRPKPRAADQLHSLRRANRIQAQRPIILQLHQRPARADHDQRVERSGQGDASVIQIVSSVARCLQRK